MKKSKEVAVAAGTPTVKSTIEAITEIVKATALFYKNPKTGNAVGYLRARALGLINDSKVEFGMKDPKTGKFLTLEEAIKQKLIRVKMLKQNAVLTF